jgi:hypothetical protein
MLLDLTIRKISVHWVNGNENIKALKEEIYNSTKIPTHKQSLTFRNKQMHDDMTLGYYGVSFHSTVNVAQVQSAGPSRPSTSEYPLVMGPLELEHHRYLLEKVVKLFLQDEEPNAQVSQAGLLISLAANSISLQSMEESLDVFY